MVPALHSNTPIHSLYKVDGHLLFFQFIFPSSSPTYIVQPSSRYYRKLAYVLLSLLSLGYWSTHQQTADNWSSQPLFTEPHGSLAIIVSVCFKWTKSWQHVANMSKDKTIYSCFNIKKSGPKMCLYRSLSSSQKLLCVVSRVKVKVTCLLSWIVL